MTGHAEVEDKMPIDLESLSKRVSICEQDIRDLKTSDNDLNTRQVRVETKLDYITDQIKVIATKIDTILEQPSKRWDNVVTALAVAAITGLVTVFFMRG